MKRITSTLEDYFPVELLPEVLAKLPVKSLLRFRCVSKTWRNLIGNRDFIHKHMFQYNKMNLHEKYYLLTLEKTISKRVNFTTCQRDTYEKCAQLMTTRKYAQNNVNNMVETVWPYAGVDGLILLLSDPKRHMELCNPSIRKSLQLPRPPLILGPKSLCAVGFSSLVNDYKVVAFQFWATAKFGRAFAVYGLNDGKWRKTTRGMDVIDWSRCSVQNECVVSTKRAAHWLISYKKDPVDGGCYTHMVSFDFDSEEFSVVELPGDEVEMLWFLFVLGELIAVLGISRVRSCIWVLDKNGGKEEWNHWYSGDSSSHGYDFFCHRKDAKILYFENCEFLIAHWQWNLAWYNIRSHEKQYLISTTNACDIYVHVESLLLSATLDAQTLTSES